MAPRSPPPVRLGSSLSVERTQPAMLTSVASITGHAPADVQLMDVFWNKFPNRVNL